MSSIGRGRGWQGSRHHVRYDKKPGESLEEQEAARTLAELNPRSPGKPLQTQANSISKLEDKMLAKDETQANENDATPQTKIDEDDPELKELLTIDEQFKPLLVLLEQFSPGEDGILFNRKLRQFESAVTGLCTDETKLQQAFGSFRAAALLNPVTTRKLVAVGASFTRQPRQRVLRGGMLNVVMQDTFAKLNVLEKANPKYLINAANLMGDYFAEARLSNGNKVHILAGPLLKYMKSLLKSNDFRAHRSLATQLMQNGRELLTLMPAQMDRLMLKIRERLLSNPTVNIVWLLLSSDLCLNKFLPLPNGLQHFYAAHLELSTEENQEQFNEVAYGSWKKTSESDEKETISPEATSQSISQLNISDEDGAKPKLRPILGAGAGLLRQDQGPNGPDSAEPYVPKTLAQRYDLNSWRQIEEEPEEPQDIVFTPPPVLPNTSVPPPPTTPSVPQTSVGRNPMWGHSDHDQLPLYLQQGDGIYIQNHVPNQYYDNANNANYSQDKNNAPVQFVQYERPLPERVNNETQKAANVPLQDWRKEKGESMEENKKGATEHRSRTFTRGAMNAHAGDENRDRNIVADKQMRGSKSRSGSRTKRQGVGERKSKPSASQVPRSPKYWSHDDRCDVDYHS